MKDTGCEWDENDRRKHCELVIELKGQMETIKEIMEREKLDRHEWRENMNLSISNLDRDVKKIMEIANRLYFPYKVVIVVFIGIISFAATKLAELFYKFTAK